MVRMLPMMAAAVLVLSLPATTCTHAEPFGLAVSPTRKVLRRARTPTMAQFSTGPDDHHDGSAAPGTATATQLLALTAGSHAGAGVPCETPVSFDGGNSWSCGEDADSLGRAGGLQLNGFAPRELPGWWVKFGDTLLLDPAGAAGFGLTSTLMRFPSTDPTASRPSSSESRPGRVDPSQPTVTSPISGNFPPGTQAWQCAGVSPLPTAHAATNHIAVPLQRCGPKPNYPWRGERVSAVLCETHLLTGSYKISGSAGNSTLILQAEWRYAGMVANKSTIGGAEAAEAASSFPLYFASEPSLVALTPTHWVVAMRASADDDDGARPLDPAAVLSNASTYTNWDSSIAGFCMYKGVFKPEITSSSQFFTGKERNAPLAWARTTDGGASWSSSMMAQGQGVGVLPRLAYDPVTNVLLLSYGSLSYPRRGHGLLASTDFGHSWIQEVHVDSLLTSGYTWLARVGPGKFVIALDAAPPQSGCGDSACDPRCSPMGEAFWVGVSTVVVKGYARGEEANVYPRNHDLIRANQSSRPGHVADRA
eukprot:COSAG02_NODE_716_length_18084_cov_101.241145_11_plen_535_part_00